MAWTHSRAGRGWSWKSHAVLGLIGSAGLSSVGCSNPLDARTERELHRSAVHALRAEIDEAERMGELRTLTRANDSVASLEIRDRDLDTIRREYSIDSYLERLRTQGGESEDPVAPLLAEDLLGRPQQTIRVGLSNAIGTSLTNNLDSRVARFGPAIAEGDVVRASAAFDWLFSTSVEWQDTDTPQPGAGFLGLGAVVASEQSVSSTTGLSRRLPTGATFGVNQTLTYTDVRSSGFGAVGDPNPATTVGLGLELRQPLLRGFGSDVNLAEVRLARNTERAQISRLRGTLITTLTDVEGAYWDLVSSYHELIIRSKLLDRGQTVREDIKARRVQDARQAQVADAIATAERRRGDLLRAQTELRRRSDALKALLDDPGLPVGGETLILPADPPVDEPITYSLADALATALTSRPEVEQAILTIDDSSIRQQVARNARLPRLDLTAQLTMLGLDSDADGAYDDAFEREFIDGFLLGAVFEQPIGNRAGLAGERQARLRRMQSVVEYRRTLRNIALDVKNALDTVVLNYKLVSQARLSRIAQAEALRALEVEKELTSLGYSAERLNLELSQQEALAQAEIAEISALVEYNRAIARLHAATGTTLERNRIDFIVPDANQLGPGERALDYEVPD